MKKRDDDSRSVANGSGGAEFIKQKKRRLGGKGLSLEAFVGAKSKPIITASQIRKQREIYQNAKKVQKYRKTLKHLADEGHEFKPLVPLSLDAEISGQDVSELGVGNEQVHTASLAEENRPLAGEVEIGSDKKQIGGHRRKVGKAKKPPHLERLREEYEKKKQEEEAARKERHELFVKQQATREKSKKNVRRYKTSCGRKLAKDSQS